ncbi:MAG TPA: magnesium transporter [Kofleriaceae bacterium]
MAGSDDGIPEPLAEQAPRELTGEVSMLPPDEAAEVIAEIKAVAELRGEDSEVVELVDLPQTGRARRPSAISLPPLSTGELPAIQAEPAPVEEDDDQLSIDELRDAWPLLDLEERSDGLRVLPREDAEEFFIGLSSHDEAQLMLHFRPGQRRQWMRLLEPDDVADVVQSVDEEHRQTLLSLLDDTTRKEVLALLAYAEDEAGGLMSTRFARLRPTMTADEALSYLRRQARAKLETIYVAYVVDTQQRLMGVVSFRELFAAEPKKLVSDIMETDVVRVTDDMDQESVSRLFAEHDLNVIPVVDKDGKMKGIVTVDDIVDVVQEAATEDIQKLGGVAALEVPYLQSTRREMLKKRVGVLIGMLLCAALTAVALGSFEGQIDAVPILAVFMTLIVSAGGNSGTQASTLVVRAMALGEVRGADWWLIMQRELITGLVLGTLLGAAVAVGILAWGAIADYGHFELLAIVAGLSVLGCVVFGNVLGSMLPFMMRRMGADPASSSAPVVTVIVDVTGILIYFTIANILLRGVLL